MNPFHIFPAVLGFMALECALSAAAGILSSIPEPCASSVYACYPEPVELVKNSPRYYTVENVE